MSLLLFCAAAFFWGMSLVRLIAGDVLRGPARWGAGWLAGVFSFSFAAFLWGLAGGRLSPGFVWALCGVSLAGSAFLWHRGRSVESSDERLVQPYTPLEWAGLLGLALFSLAALLTFATMPLTAGDSLVIWAFQGRVIFENGVYPPAELKDTAFLMAHPQYPPLLPMAEALLSFLHGSFDERLVRVIPSFSYFAMLAILWEELPRRNSRLGVLLFLVFALMPSWTIYELGGATAGMADPTVGALVLATVVILGRGRENNGKALRWRKLAPAALAGMLLAFAGLVKNEGLVLGVLVLVGAGVTRKERREVLTLAAVWFLILLPWFLVRGQLNPDFEENYGGLLSVSRIAGNLPRLPEILLEMGKQFLFRPHRAGPFWWIVGVLAVFGTNRQEVWMKSFLWIVPVYFAILAGIYLISPWSDIQQVQVSFDRLLLQVAPLAIRAAAGAAQGMSAPKVAASLSPLEPARG